MFLSPQLYRCCPEIVTASDGWGPTCLRAQAADTRSAASLPHLPHQRDAKASCFLWHLHSRIECISERQNFGWNLQGRQEVIGHLREAETPDNLGQAVWRGFVEGATETKTVEYDHYVKLHFQRSLGLRSLPKIRELEAEYFSLPLPSRPGSLFWPIVFTLMPIPGGLMGLVDPTGKRSPGIFITVSAAFWMFLGIRWIRSRRRRTRQAAQICEMSRTRATAITEEAASLLQ